MIDLDPRLSTTTIKPISDVCARSLNEWSCMRTGDILLNEIGEVIDLAKESHPTIISSIMKTNFFSCIVSLLRR